MKKMASNNQKPEQNPWASSIPGCITAGADDRINLIKQSTDIAWLNSVLRYGDNQLTVRKAAERQLRKLSKAEIQIETAYTFRNGEIQFGTSVPEGALLIGKGPKQKLHDAVFSVARLSYPTKRGGDDSVLLVPGIPEAKNDNEALEALTAFFKQVRARLVKA